MGVGFLPFVPPSLLFPLRWRSPGPGCPGRLWSLLLWRYSRPPWTRSSTAYCRWPCFSRRIWLDDPQRSHPTPTILWFCDSLILFPHGKVSALSGAALPWAMGVEVNALDWAALREETRPDGHPPSPSPAHAWQDETGNAEAMRASLQQLCLLCQSPCVLARTRQLWVGCRSSGGPGSGNNEGIHFDRAVAGRRGNKMDNRGCCRLPVHWWKGTELYMLEIRHGISFFILVGWRRPDTASHCMWRGLWWQLLIAGHSREWKYQQVFEEQTVGQKGEVCSQKERKIDQKVLRI